MKLLRLLNNLGGDSFSMACVFLFFCGVVPSLSMWYPSQSICLHSAGISVRS